MLRNTAEESDEIKLLDIFGSEINSANLVRVLIAGVETRFNSSREIASSVLFVNVPWIWTTWRLPVALAKSLNAEMFKPVILTNSASAACDGASGTLRHPTPMASDNTSEPIRARAK